MWWILGVRACSVESVLLSCKECFLEPLYEYRAKETTFLQKRRISGERGTAANIAAVKGSVTHCTLQIKFYILRATALHLWQERRIFAGK